MKFIIALVALGAVCASAQNFEQRPIAILRQAADINPDGAYSYNYETENGISAQEQGVPSVQGPEGAAVAASGSYSYRGDDNVVYTINYVANENGFQPQGEHLPVAPPVPEAIQRALEYIARNPQPEQQQQQGFRRF